MILTERLASASELIRDPAVLEAIRRGGAKVPFAERYFPLIRQLSQESFEQIDIAELNAEIEARASNAKSSWELFEQIDEIFAQASAKANQSVEQIQEANEARTRLREEYKAELNGIDKEIAKIDSLEKPNPNWQGKLADQARASYRAQKNSKVPLVGRKRKLEPQIGILEEEIIVARERFVAEKENRDKTMQELDSYKAQVLAILRLALVTTLEQKYSKPERLNSVKTATYQNALKLVSDELVMMLQESLPRGCGAELRQLQRDIKALQSEIASIKQDKEPEEMEVGEVVDLMRKCRQFKQLMQEYADLLEVEKLPKNSDEFVETFDVHRDNDDRKPLLFQAKIDFRRVAKDEYTKDQIRKAAESGLALRAKGSIGFKEFNGDYKLKLLGRLGNSRLFGHLDASGSGTPVWTAEPKLTKNGHSNKCF